MGERERKGNHSPILTSCCGCFRMSSTICWAASCWEGRCSAGLQLVLSRYKVWICFPTLRAGSRSMDGVYRKSPGGSVRDKSREDEPPTSNNKWALALWPVENLESGPGRLRPVQLPCGNVSRSFPRFGPLKSEKSVQKGSVLTWD